MWRLAALISALLALGSWIVLCLIAQPSRIEVALHLETERALAEADLGDIRSIVDGRDVALEGLVASPTALAETERLVADVAGIRTVDNRLVVREVAVTPLPTELEISVGPAGVSLRGAVPNEILKLAIVEDARQLFGIDRVDDELMVNTAIQDGAALAGVTGVIRALADAGEGVKAILEGDSVRLTGTVTSDVARRRIERQARAAAPEARLFFSMLTVNAGRAGGI